MNLKTITQDGIPVETTDAGATVISTLNQRVADKVAENIKLVTDHRAALDAKDAEIAKLSDAVKAKDGELAAKDAEIDKLKKASDPATLDALIAERSDVLTAAALIATDIDFRGKSAADIRRMAVVAQLGDAVKDKSDDYIAARFDALVEEAKEAGEDVGGDVNAGNGGTGDQIADSLRGARPVVRGNGRALADAAHNDYAEYLRNAYKTPAGKAN